jgi:uncharacterized cupredoxin-like copper-binding protein
MKLKVILGILAFTASTLAYADIGHKKEVSSIGKPSNPNKVNRIINIDMDDTMRFTPNKILVKRGETIKFIVNNSGKLKHEMVLGNLQELKEHAEMMRAMPDMEHEDDNQVSVEPGKKGEIIWKFNKKGTVNFGCLKPGHFEAGMKGNFIVK